MIRTFRPLSVAAALLALVALAACGGRNADKPTQVVKNTYYQASQPVADRYENLEGTALFDVSPDVATQLGAAADQAPGGIDSFFVLLNPKAPTEGILVRAGSSVEKGAIQNQTSRKLTVTGSVKVFKGPSMLSHFQEKFGISLARDAQGNPVWIDNEAPLPLDPKASASPKTVKAPGWLGHKPAPGAALPPGLAAPAGPTSASGGTR